jgi:hypothetical protein
MQVEMINYLPQEQTVYVAADLEYVNGHIGGDVSSGLLSATGKLFTETLYVNI